MLEKLMQGFFFVCSNPTQDECFDRMLFGSTLEYEGKVLEIRKGDVGFLYNLDTDVLYGVFEAVSDGYLNIEPRAWKGSFPAQVRVNWMEKFVPRREAKSLLKKLHIRWGNLLLTGEETVKLRNALEGVPEIEEDFREKYPRKYRTQDGHYVRTKSETILDDWLYHHLIVHGYERKVPIAEDMYSDFYVPQGQCYIEYWGIEDEEYSKRKDKKKALYSKYGLNLVELARKDIENIDDILPKKLIKFGVKIV